MVLPEKLHLFVLLIKDEHWIQRRSFGFHTATHPHTATFYRDDGNGSHQKIISFANFEEKTVAIHIFGIYVIGWVNKLWNFEIARKIYAVVVYLLVRNRMLMRMSDGDAAVQGVAET